MNPVKKYRETGLYVLSLIPLIMVSFLTQHNSTHLTAGIQVTAFAAALLMQLGLFLAARSAQQNQWPPEKRFLLLYIPLSLGMMLVLPLGRAPDEISHVNRSWQILIGQWLEGGGDFFVPSNLMGWVGKEYHNVTLYGLLEQAGTSMSWDVTVPSSIGTATGVYPVNNYFPQAAGMWLMSLLSDNRLLIMYGSRLGAWAVTVFLYYYAVKKIPYGKFTLIAVSLFPMFLQEAASASADGLTCGAVIAFFAYFLDLKVHPRLLKKKEYLILFLLAFHTCTYKIFYFPVAFLLLAIPEECYGSKRRKALANFWILLVSLAVVIGWLLICKTSYADPAEKSDWGTGNILPQLTLILRDPFGFLIVIFRTLIKEALPYASGMLGRGLSWGNIRLPVYLSALQILAILGAFLCDSSMTGTGTPPPENSNTFCFRCYPAGDVHCSVYLVDPLRSSCR